MGRVWYAAGSAWLLLEACAATPGSRLLKDLPKSEDFFNFIYRGDPIPGANPFWLARRDSEYYISSNFSREALKVRYNEAERSQIEHLMSLADETFIRAVWPAGKRQHYNAYDLELVVMPSASDDIDDEGTSTSNSALQSTRAFISDSERDRIYLVSPAQSIAGDDDTSSISTSASPQVMSPKVMTAPEKHQREEHAKDLLRAVFEIYVGSADRRHKAQKQHRQAANHRFSLITPTIIDEILHLILPAGHDEPYMRPPTTTQLEPLREAYRLAKYAPVKSALHMLQDEDAEVSQVRSKWTAKIKAEGFAPEVLTEARAQFAKLAAVRSKEEKVIEKQQLQKQSPSSSSPDVSSRIRSRLQKAFSGIQ